VETVQIDTWIRARGEDCFDAARDLDLHVTSLAHTKEKAIGGRTSGLIELGEEVTWRGRHFGVYQTFTSKITAFDRPRYFQDTMQRGAFESFVHDHYFTTLRGGTAMRDVVMFAAPLGILGRLVERVVLRRYVERLLMARAAAIKQSLESLGSTA
jgi:ligand-binding SRPBCC domain-containing protein